MTKDSFRVLVADRSYYLARNLTELLKYVQQPLL